MPSKSEQPAEQIKQTELALQKGLQGWILAGLAFMLAPGTYWGGWNLIRIAGAHAAGQADRSWLQAHGHAQIFGWVGSFILGIGFYSLTKMAHVPSFAVWRMWASLGLWVAGVALRWASNLWRWEWRLTLPVSALLELAAFGLFLFTVRRHRGASTGASPSPVVSRTWFYVVLAGTVAFLASLAANFITTLDLAMRGVEPALPPQWNQRLLVLFTWAFPVLTIWGFSARWLPVFLGLPDPSPQWLLQGVVFTLAATVAAWAGFWSWAALLFLFGSLSAVLGLRVFRPSVKPPKTAGVHAHFPFFVRMAYGWLLVSAALATMASMADRAGGWWGASRHALTVGFISTMVFAIGQRVLPAFCGMRVLFSPPLMGWGLWSLTLGCALRIVAQIGAYESYLPQLWPLLTISALLEMFSFTLFALNLVLTMQQPPAHLMARAA